MVETFRFNYPTENEKKISFWKIFSPLENVMYEVTVLMSRVKFDFFFQKESRFLLVSKDIDTLGSNVKKSPFITCTSVI